MDASKRRLLAEDSTSPIIPLPYKRLKKDDSSSDSSDSDEPLTTEGEQRAQDELQENLGETEIEHALPPTLVDDKAIREYEELRSSQLDEDDQDEASEDKRPLWIKGKSSIYVDAFNLALDTVLEEESKLFSHQEHEVFRQWKTLEYEVQYLYVRLFLRKTAVWHRISRLGYYNDISDPDAAIRTLQLTRQLPETTAALARDEIPGIELDVMDEDGSFTFADSSADHITTVEEAASLMYLDELKALAKDVKVQGRVKADFIKGFCRASQQQTRLIIPNLQNKQRSTNSPQQEASNRDRHLLTKILGIVGPCIRLSPLSFKLFERVHLVFYRSMEWTEKSLTTIILAKISRWNFADYIVCRTSTIFASRLHLLEFEAAIRLEAVVDQLLEVNASQAEASFSKLIDLFEKVYPRWKVLMAEEAQREQYVHEPGEGAYLRRFNAAHSYTRVIVKAAYVFGRRKDHTKEYDLLTKLLDQKLFHLARRGAWYQRKALLEEHYMAGYDADAGPQDAEQRKKAWMRTAVSTCETGLQDPDCHLIHHYDLQKRLIKLEKKLRIPRRLQHDFGHVRLAEPVEIFVEGIQVKRAARAGPQQGSSSSGSGSKTVWLDERDSGGECSVEQMCLSHFRSQGWKGYHSEGGIVRTLFAYLFYDILFLYIPNVFQTAFQTCPLDLHTDAFFAARASEINARLAEIANGEGERILRQVWEREHERRTSVVGLRWDFDVEDLAELVGCFEGAALGALCKVMAQEYRQRGGGVPDLILWRVAADTPTQRRPRGEVMFAEVKSCNDRLSDSQRLWIHVLAGAGVKVALCNAVAREVHHIE